MSIDPNTVFLSQQQSQVEEIWKDSQVIENDSSARKDQWIGRTVQRCEENRLTSLFKASSSRESPHDNSRELIQDSSDTEEYSTEDLRIHKPLKRSICNYCFSPHGELSELDSSVDYKDITPLSMDGLGKYQTAIQIGNKAASLVYLQKALGEEASVPHFLPIQHKEILRHILTYYPAYEEDWVQVQNSLSDETLTEDSLNFLSQIQERIEDLFKTHRFNTSSIENFLSQFDEESLLMVRSSGMEDSIYHTNAGGNLSVAGVRIAHEAISEAIGQVVASYFSHRSMTQRSLVKDSLSKTPLLPVFLQVMIGERIGNTNPLLIPVSGVAYTEEVLGQTEGLYQIQATFGHNEGVVDSLLLVDTYYVYKDGSHHDVIRPKTRRLVADMKGGYELVENPTSFIERSALSHELIVRLRHVLDRIHSHYGFAVDVEWVYDQSQDQFYIVQVRPIVHRVSSSPSYLDFEALKEKSAIQLILQGEVVAMEGGQCLCIEHPEEILYETNLERAFSAFSQRANIGLADSIKAVIVNRAEVATSHYACVLRELGIHVFTCSEFNSNIFSKKGDGKILFLDSQTSRIILAKFQDSPLDANLLSVIRSGWYRHPIHAIESIQKREFQDKEIVNLLWKTFMVSESEEHEAGDKRDVRGLLADLSSHDITVAKSAMRQLAKWLYHTISSLTDSSEKRRGVEILKNILLIGLQIETGKHMYRMHAAKRIEALLLQRNSAEIVRADSLLQLLLERSQLREFDLSYFPKPSVLELEKFVFFENRAKAIHRERLVYTNHENEAPCIEEIRRVFTLCQVAKKVILSPKIAEDWSLFFQKILSSKSRFALSRLVEMIKTFQRLHVLESWVNISFPEAYKKSLEDIADTLQLMHLELREIRSALEQVSEANDHLQEFKEREALWADSDKFEELFNQFNEKVFSRFYEFQKTYFAIHDGKTIVKTAFMKYFHAVIDVYDRAIKIMKSSPLYADRSLQAIRFKEMLIPYQNVVNYWVRTISFDLLKEWTRAIHPSIRKECHDDFREGALERINEQFEAIEDLSEAQLYPTPDFNVSAAVINSGRADSQYSLHRCTLEDLFTLMHQDVLAAFMATHKEQWEELFPDEMRLLHETITSIQDSIEYMETILEIKTNILTTEYTHPRLTTKYNIPIKNHSTVIEVVYDVIKKNARIDVKMIGHNMNDRMTQTAEKIFMRSMAAGIEFHEVPLYDEVKRALTFSVHLFESDLQGTHKLDCIRLTLLEAIHDTLAGTWGVIQNYNLDELDQVDMDVWTHIISNSRYAQHFLLHGGYYYVEKLILRLIQHKREDILSSLLANYGVQIPSTDESLEFKIARACLNGIQSGIFQVTFTREGFLPFTGVSSFDKFVESFLRRDPKHLHLAFEEKKTVYSEENSLGEKLFSANLHLWMFSSLIAGRSMSEIESLKAKDFIVFLAQSDLFDSLALIYILHCLPDSERVPPSVRSLIESSLEERWIDVRVVSRQLRSFKNWKNVKTGEFVFIQVNDSSLMVAKVVRITPYGVEVQFKEGKSRLITDIAQIKRV